MQSVVDANVESKQAWFDAHTPNRRPLWLVLIDNNYAGWMSFNSFYGRPAYDGTVEVSIYLEESARGKGLFRPDRNHAGILSVK